MGKYFCTSEISSGPSEHSTLNRSRVSGYSLHWVSLRVRLQHLIFIFISQTCIYRKAKIQKLMTVGKYFCISDFFSEISSGPSEHRSRVSRYSLHWVSLRARLHHQAFATTQSQHCNDACHIALIEKNSHSKMGCNPILVRLYLFRVISMRPVSQASSQRSVDSALTLTLSVRAHLHLATATSLPNLINCFGVALLHLATAMSLGNRFVSHSGAMLQRHRRRVAVARCKWALNGLLQRAKIWKWKLIVASGCSL